MGSGGFPSVQDKKKKVILNIYNYMNTRYTGYIKNTGLSSVAHLC